MSRITMYWPVVLMILGLTFGKGEQVPPDSKEAALGEPPATTQPTSAPATHRRPSQAKIIENLLRDREKVKTILPQAPQSSVNTDVTSIQPFADQSDQNLLPDGTMLVERPGRLVREDGKSMFVFHSDTGTPQLQTMEILPNGFLEAMERRAEYGNAEFVISCEVTRYRNRNFVLLTKILQRVQHGNLRP
ncbi:MAG: hypothetical protein ABIG44_05340 [Planctomycetota bacterium]